jgi:hypothetical protein
VYHTNFGEFVSILGAQYIYIYIVKELKASLSPKNIIYISWIFFSKVFSKSEKWTFLKCPKSKTRNTFQKKVVCD